MYVGIQVIEDVYGSVMDAFTLRKPQQWLPRRAFNQVAKRFFGQLGEQTDSNVQLDDAGSRQQHGSDGWTRLVHNLSSLHDLLQQGLRSLRLLASKG